MDPTEFRRLVRHGLGRAVLHLQQNDPEPYIDVILEACRTNDCYDRQVNGNRTQYYWGLMNAAYAIETILPRLMDDFSATNDVPYWIFDLVERFALRGNERSRDFLISAFDRDPLNWAAIDAILTIEGVPGVTRISRELRKHRQNGEDVHDAARHALSNAEREPLSDRRVPSDEKLYSTDVRRAIEDLRELAKRKPRRIDQIDPTSRRNIRLKNPSDLPFKDVWRWVEQQINTGRIRSTSIVTPNGIVTYRDWGMHTNDRELEHAAHELAAAALTDVARIARYAQIFLKRRYPLDPQPLVDAIETNIDSGDRDYWTDAAGWAVHCCLWALSWASDPALSRMALELRTRSDHWRSYWTLLFPSDANTEYVDLLSESIRSETDEEVIHSWGADLVRRIERVPAQVFAEPLKLFYDLNPCGVCRYDTVKLLHDLNALPDWIIEECHYDSDEATRAIVGALSG